MIRQLLPLVGAAALSACATVPQSGGSADSFSDTLVDREASGALALFPILDREAGPDKNVVYSPASVDQAFGLLRLGASGDTAAQLDAILPAPRSADYLRTDKDDVEVRIANALFLSDDFRFRESYLVSARRRYDATAQAIDVAKPDASAKQINSWADKATEGLIPEVISPSAITPDLVAVLANALYFDGKWQQKLLHGSTRDFLYGDGSERPFKFVGDVQEQKLVETGGLTALRLPYRNTRYAMDIIVPSKRGVMRTAPQTDRIESMGKALDAATPRPVDIAIPQFEVEYDTGLVPTLQALGLTLPFQKDRADLSALVEPGQTPVWVSDVRHLTKLQVFDEGTRAAAVTTVSIITTGSRIYRVKPVPFVADQPFVIVIRDLQEGEVLFIGRIADPQEFTPEVEPY